MNLEALYEVTARIVRTSEIGDSGHEKRSDFYLEGEVKGRISGKISGVDYGSARRLPGGDVVVIHVHETITTDKGLISVLRRGYAISRADGSYEVRAFCLYRTGIKELDFLNTAVAAVEGTARDGALNLKVYQIA